MKRLGVVKGGAKMIKKHAWFKDMDWNALVEKKLTAPFVPDIKNDEDTSNFEVEEDDDDEIDPYEDDGTDWEADF